MAHFARNGGSLSPEYTPATTFDLKYKGGTVFYIHPHNSAKADAWYPVNIFHIQQYFEKESFEGSYNDTYVREIVNYLRKEKGLKKTGTATATGEPYVLIIDEINRGNISQIFGELITLIEDGKRIGETEELSVTLPYSREVFSVPPNLYIIGTMNTADRSVEALDTALRRRFTFEFIPPASDLLDQKQINSINLKELLDTINLRISYLLDDDHKIGHSYFLSVTDIDSLRSVFSKSIIPLLKEYFYNDYGKIRMVLGDAFVIKKTGVEAKPKFAVNDEGFVMEKTVYVINPVDNDFDIVAALTKTLANG